jgi:protein-S-isoprenylcysteine O-methyltransferase
MVIGIISTFFAISEVALVLFKRADATNARDEDRGSMRLVWLVVACSLATAIAFQWVASARLPSFPALRQTLALTLLIGGLGIRWYSILSLGRMFTVDVVIQNGHSLVEKGIYRYVRHPSYAGLLLAFCGIAASFWNWLSILALVVPVTLAILSRIRTEEAALLDTFGASYEVYCAKTKRLIPGLY